GRGRSQRPTPHSRGHHDELINSEEGVRHHRRRCHADHGHLRRAGLGSQLRQRRSRRQDRAAGHRLGQAL
ncbi:MAG: hypothetical protein AVDCRST_MAG47-675, partial [uncultured Nocardioidaceae bacterium]